LGDGAFGSVSKAVHKASGAVRAVKSISKVRVGKNPALEREKFLNEVKLLSEMDHPNILRIFEFYEDERNYHLVTELCTGGELFDYIIERKHLTERMAANVMYQLLSAIIHCHDKNVAHRDIKPENMLLELPVDPKSTAPDLHIKVIDFGTSCLFQPENKLHAKYGTPYYIAPEVIERDYDHRCDVWSAGVIMYILLCGKPPFNGASDNEIMERVKQGRVAFREP
jgi:calcium-dependent protein kinase